MESNTFTFDWPDFKGEMVVADLTWDGLSGFVTVTMMTEPGQPMEHLAV